MPWIGSHMLIILGNYFNVCRFISFIFMFLAILFFILFIVFPKNKIINETNSMEIKDPLSEKKNNKTIDD